MKKLLGVLVILAMASGLVGCATTDAGRTKQEGTAAGAGVGALVGGIIGNLVGGNTAGTLVGAAVGTAIGGVAGYAYGDHVASQKAKYAKQEDWLNACIASARKVTADTEKYNQKMSQEIAKLDAESATMLADYKKKKITAGKLEETKENVDKMHEESTKKLKKANFELECQEKAMAQLNQKKSPQGAQKLEAEIKLLKGQIKELEAHTKALASISSRMSV